MMLHHVTMHVSNLAHTVDLLDAFGFACVMRETHAAWIQAPNTYLHLRHDSSIIPTDHNFTDGGISHICIQTPDMHQAIRILRAHAARPLSDPINLGTGHWYLYARLPDGDIIEIEGVPYAPAGTTPWLAHVALVSTDVTRISDFYRQLTTGIVRGGHTVGPNPRFDTGLQLPHAQMIPCWVVGGNLTIECWQFLNPPSHARRTPPYAYREIGFVCANPQTCAQQAIRYGATLVATSAEVVYLHDPDGNLIALTHVQAVKPQLATYADPQIIARINAHWQPLDPQHTWEATHG